MREILTDILASPAPIRGINISSPVKAAETMPNLLAECIRTCGFDVNTIGYVYS